jgi:hypothetical protein
VRWRTLRKSADTSSFVEAAMFLQTKDGEYAMPEAVFGAYLKLYPSAEHEFARMLIWLETNPARRPASPKSAPRFVENWFKRVPRVAHHNPVREQRAATVAALTGRNRSADVIDMPAFADRVGGADIRAVRVDVREPEARVDVDGRGPGARQIALG